MKFVCDGTDLSDALMKVTKACSAKTTNPILETVKLSAANDTLTLTATDGELAIQKKIRAEVLDEGAFCVPGKYFADFIKRLENEQITMTSEESTVVIRYGDSVSSMQILSADDFPAIETDVNENRIELSAKDLKELIAKTTFCCAQDDSRPVLKGCLIETKEGCVTFTALVQRLIAMVKAFQTGSGTFWVEGLQLIIAVLLIALGVTIVVNSLRAYFAAKKDSETAPANA